MVNAVKNQIGGEKTMKLPPNQRMAPRGKLIRDSKMTTITDSSVANCDTLKRTSQMWFRIIAWCCMLAGSSLVLFLPILSEKISNESSRSILSTIQLRFESQNAKDDTIRQLKVGELNNSRSKRIAYLRHKRVAADSPPLMHTKEHAPSSELSIKTHITRLASYDSSVVVNENYTEAQRRQVIEKSSQIAIFPKETKSPGLIKRVHLIISKHAPKQQSVARLAESIINESARQDYDPLFVAAVIKAESTFNTSARSNKGAQGLMQIMPATGAWISSKNGYAKGRLTDPGHNLKLGISYLKYLEREFNGNRLFALVAYNWGPGHLDSATDGKKRIPKECMRYALKILSDYRSWQSGVI